MELLFEAGGLRFYWAGRGFVSPGMHVWVPRLRRHLWVLPVRREWLA